MSAIRILIADDHRMVREGLRTLLETTSDLQVVGEADHGEAAIEQALALQRRAGGRFAFHFQPGLIYEHIDLHLGNPILADRRVRQALILSADRAQIVARLFDGRQPVAHSNVNPLDGVHDSDVRQWPFDLARARTLLEEAGWRPGPDGIRRNPAGERLVLDFMTTAGNRSREQVQQVLAAGWRQAGIEMRVRNEPPRVFFSETVTRRRYGGLAMFAWISSPESVPRSTLHSDEIPTPERNWSGQNTTGFTHPRMGQARRRGRFKRRYQRCRLRSGR
jgi:peptide/nickel transport system substrate-binding protein